MRLILTVLLVTLSSYLHSQTMTVKGTVVASKENLQFGQIAVFKSADSTLVKGAFMDSMDLNFSFPRGDVF